MLYNASRAKNVTYVLLLYGFLSGVDLQTVVDGGNLLSTIKKIFSLWSALKTIFYFYLSLLIFDNILLFSIMTL